ncbi:type I-F CRISPR-associated endoribonuclease Cas6/Csy4 [Colwellia sp. 6M3]|uniref:type I-F CRISPR-associated endoribonuclease Cas6/Csy4 n=1 Tax=Colwellia sp. 6M3 TaxID=2759849 RepID=UPI0015F6B063|nr:type I-F CRISPR-associated endoribonuclease Cas6/Csy4 [Colwellia sp. 6M3]MBA6416885.1 type I-F CRISPR-associated endoribonuclease Cas6/Csy4 [Colwellia sp. 6M3]
MMKRFYFIISFLGDDINEALLVGRCLKILHGFYHRQNIVDVGVSFPDWSNTSIGKRIAFVSINESSLKFLKAQKYFVEMEEMNYFLISKVNECILEPQHSAIFSRNQKIDELTIAAQKRKLCRLIKRAEKRGEVYQPKREEPFEAIIPFCHKIPASSHGNQNDFELNIEKKVFSEANTSTFNSYGLSTNLKIMNPVPIIFDDT